MNENTAILIRQLSDVKFEKIHSTAIEAFADYQEPFALSISELAYLLKRRGYDPNLSFGAFDNDNLVGFILNGIRNWDGKLTAYDTGTGLIKKYRRRGIATKIFDESLPILIDNHINQYLLEVIRTNEAAFELYRNKGFSINREFDCYVTEKPDIRINKNKIIRDAHIKIIQRPDWELFRSFWDFEPSWQNSIDSLCQKVQHLTILGIFEKVNIIGYGIVERHTGDIPQIGIHKSFRRNGFATSLMKKLLEYSESSEIRLINTLSGYAPFREFANSINLKPSLGQYEMILEL